MRSTLRRAVLLLAILALVPAVPGLAGAQADNNPDPGDLIRADDFTGTAGPLAPGQIEVGVLSTRAAAVTGGDALVGIRGVDDADTVTVNDVDVTDEWTLEPDPYAPDASRLVGMVDGLPLGTSDLAVTVEGPSGIRAATLPVDNHPITGPVFSGPHQELFDCRADELDDFDPDGDDRPAITDEPTCDFDPYVRWYYLSTSPPTEPFDPVAAFEDQSVPGDTWDWVPLTDASAYPSDMAQTVTTAGDVVPAIARVETRNINRGITRVAALDDPVARGAFDGFDGPNAWNDKVIYNWGASCGIGRQQGKNSPSEVLSGGVDAGGSALDVGPEVFRPAVLQGYVTAHSTLTTFNTHCNQVLSAETMMMVREHLVEAYGQFNWIMGNGASGGAIQQYTTMNGYPGLQDGGLPLVSFPDVVTTAMSPTDCRLLRQVFDLTDDPYPVQAQFEEGAGRELPLYPNWTVDKRNAITGHNFQGICEDWDAMFADLLVADKDCSRIPQEIRYDRQTGTGERCTLQDNLVHFLGTDPETGYARRPVDNIGVQYGYQALLDGVISVEEFLWLNRNIGGFDDEGYGPWHPGEEPHVPEGEVQPRMTMDPDLAEDLYEYGFVTGRGALDQAPIIDVNLYADPVPILGFHDQVRGYMMSERITEEFGAAETHSVWSGAVLTNDAWSTMATWLDGVEEARAQAGGVSPDGWTDEVVGARPAQGDDSCVATTAGYSPVPLAVPGIAGDRDQPCEQVFQVGGSPRIAAGGPTTEDVIKCRLKAPEQADYPGVEFSADQWAELNEVFADGVCDWSQPGVGQDVDSAGTWLDFSDFDADTPGSEPTRIPNLVARSAG